MKLLSLALAVLVILTHHSFAQTPKDAPQTIDERLGITQPKPKEKTSGDLIKDQALRYYGECTAHKHALFSKETQQLHCGCISNNMIEIMKPDDILALYDDTQAGKKSREIFFTRVHGACAKYPVYDHVMNKCMSNKGFQKSMLRKHRNVCECTADTIARYVDNKPVEKMVDQLSRTPESQDPLKDFILGHEFTSMHNIYMRRCVVLHIIDPPS